MEISFKANVILDKNYAKKPPKHVDEKNLLDVARQYKEIMENPKTIGGALTEGDTVVLSTKNSKEGYYLSSDFYKEGDKEPCFSWFTCKSRAVKRPFSDSDLFYATALYLGEKYGYQKKPSDNALKLAQKSLEYAIEQYKNSKNKN